MTKKKTRIRWVTPRRIAGAGCLVGLALVAVFVVVLYQQVRNLFAPPSYIGGGGMATQDVEVVRGSLYDGVRVYGQVKPAREAELGFRLARGSVAVVPVQPGQQVRAGELLVGLDISDLEADLALAKGELLKARKELEALDIASADTQRLELELALRDARTALDKARRDLAAYDAGQGTPQEKRAEAVAELENARAALTALRESKSRAEQLEQLRVVADLAQIAHGPLVTVENPNEWEADYEWFMRIDMLNKREAYDSAVLRYEMDIRAAERRLEAAERNLRAIDREIAAGLAAAERAGLVAAVKTAEAAMEMAQAKLNALAEGTLEVEVARAQAEVIKLEGKVADAEAALAEAQLVAPFDGTVEMVKVEPGAMISSSQAVVSLVDLSTVQVVAQVSDIDVAHLQEGMEAQLSFDALRGQEPVPARLGEIPLYGTYQGGQTWFHVPLEFDATLPQLRAGMSANVFIPTERKDDVLLIPSAAINYDGMGNFVFLVRGKGVEQRRVRLGANDGIHAEVLEGLQEGDVVRVPLMGPVGYRGG
jgi:macrolide-specific efflux system membrane fusion protein